MVVRSIEKTVSLAEVVRTIEKPVKPIVGRAHFARHDGKLNLLIVTTSLKYIK